MAQTVSSGGDDAVETRDREDEGGDEERAATGGEKLRSRLLKEAKTGVQEKVEGGGERRPVGGLGDLWSRTVLMEVREGVVEGLELFLIKLEEDSDTPSWDAVWADRWGAGPRSGSLTAERQGAGPWEGGGV